MKIIPLRTEKIVPYRQDLWAVLDAHLKSFRDRSILAVTSKIVSICEGRVVKIGSIDKRELIRKEARYFLPAHASKYNLMLTIKDSLLIPTAGIDESNGNGYYVLWPARPRAVANRVRKYLCRRFSVRNAGVIITDSKTEPLRRGTMGVAVAHSGFLAIRDYVGMPDVFGRKLKVTKADVRDALAAAAVAVMGEGGERTPLAVIEDVPFVKFQARDPSPAELRELKIGLKEDLYAPLLRGARWRKGQKRN